MPEVNPVVEDPVENEDIGLDMGLDDGDAGLDATPGEDQVARESESTPTELTLDDVPEEYRGLVQSKLKNLESGYNKKYQTLAEERKALEAEREEIIRRAGHMPPSATTQETRPDPYADVDWEMESAATRANTELIAQLIGYLQQADGRFQQIESDFTRRQLAEQMAEVHNKYGDFDEGELLAEHAKNPSVPLKYLAADMLADQLVERAKQGVYQNVETKRRVNQPNPSSAKVAPDVDTKNWSVLDFFNHAKRTGGQRF